MRLSFSTFSAVLLLLSLAVIRQGAAQDAPGAGGEPESYSSNSNRRLATQLEQCSEDPPLVNNEPELFGFNWELSTAGAIVVEGDATLGDYIEVAGYEGTPGTYAKTIQTFQRPLQVSVEVRVKPGTGGSCLGVSLFGSDTCYQTESHMINCGYHTGVGGYWLSDYYNYVKEEEFFPGQGSVKFGVVDVFVWQTLKIDVLEDGTNKYYLNGVLKHTSTTAGATEGHIAVLGCATGQYRNLLVTGIQCAAPTESPTKSPTPNPTPVPTPAPTESPTKTPTANPTKSPTANPTPAISSWALAFSKLSTDFDKDSTSEITIDYKIGKGRDHQVKLFKQGCTVELADDSGAAITASTVAPIADDDIHENLQVSVDVVKDATVLSNSNILDEDGEILSFCIIAELVDGSGNQVKEDKHEVVITLDFENGFDTVEDANLDQVAVGDQAATDQVENYVEACTCANKDSYSCNTNVLGTDDFLNVCIRSQSAEIEIDYLDSLVMTQAGTDADDLVIVETGEVTNGDISARTMAPGWNGVHVASVIPARFFSYADTSTAQVSGVVYLKLAGSRRRVAVEMDGHSEAEVEAPAPGSSSMRTLQAVSGDQESAFAINVELKKEELNLGDANGAVDTFVSGFIAAAAAIGAAAAIMLW